jgi:hypothetical protein
MSQCHDSYDPVEQPAAHVAPSNGGLLDGAQCHDTYQDTDLPVPPGSAQDGPEKPVDLSVK